MANRAPGILMAGFVAALAVYAFYDRPRPVYPATATGTERIRIDGLARGDGHLVAVGESGHLLVSTDDGKSWREAQVDRPVEATLTQVMFTDPKTGYAIGFDGLVLRSDDGGASWKHIRADENAPGPLLDLCDASGRVFVAGSFGQFFVTSDGGASWSAVPAKLQDEPHLNAVGCSPDDERMILAGEAGLVERSEDGGRTWEKLNFPYNGSIYGVLHLSRDEWLLYGMRGHVFRTDDFGRNWSSVEINHDTSFFGGTRLADGRIVLVGQDGTIVMSEDKGRSFRTARSRGREVYTAALEAGQRRMLLAGDSGLSEIGLPRTLVSLDGRFEER